MSDLGYILTLRAALQAIVDAAPAKRKYPDDTTSKCMIPWPLIEQAREALADADD